MAELDYTNLVAMNSLVVELAGLSAAPSDLDSLLTQSAATHTDDTVTVYRPYYVAAQVLRRQLNTKRLRSAKGAQFDAPSATINALIRQQASEDARLLEVNRDYDVPNGHKASTGSGITF